MSQKYHLISSVFSSLHANLRTTAHNGRSISSTMVWEIKLYSLNTSFCRMSRIHYKMAYLQWFTNKYKQVMCFRFKN